ncbi:hypothetical protein TWF106_001531 [Orbilia oligospora]|uniref:EF-hand domain-containing protein n=1 Tax=Orbilia oligospora TaxID=2813651 RepID=A0A6G1LYC3_ORBOL|nr:hypothetical protein TWF788_000008 [Orbilia oligospora]KAF3202223.1 hypothetical protein TWF679_011056 [Orbilia oligospora]KAF3204506.1 hypothetical protein TWF106_001531 [Orbilia oligospora]KAF3236217.1 hypothetical protein TWF192_011494 [Orbilia oligospora]
MSSQHPAGRAGFQPIDPAFQRPSEDHVVNIPLTPIESHRSLRTKEESVTAFNPSTDKVTRPPFERADHTLDALGPFERRGGKRRLLRDGQSFNDGEETALTKVGLLYEKILNFSFITRWMIYIAPLALALAIPIIVGSTAAPNATIGGVRIVWFFAWTEIVWCSLWISKMVAKCLPIVFKTLVGVISSGTRKYYKVIQQLEVPLSLVGWCFASFISFLQMMTNNPDKRRERLTDPTATDTKPWQSRMNLVLAAALVSSLIFLVKSVIVQLISVQYHQKQFSARILANKDYIKVLSMLLETSRQAFPAYCPEFAEEDYILHAGLVNGLGSPLAKQSGAATPMRLLHQIGRVGDNITSAVGHVAKEITGRNVLNPNSARSVVVNALARRTTIEALGRRIWMSFAEEGKDTLYVDDFLEVLGVDRQEQAKAAFIMLDKDENGDISLDEMIGTILEVARERKALAKSMGDIDSAISALNSLLSAIVFVVIIFVFVAFLNQNFVTTLGTAGATLLSLSFVFAATAQEILGSCIFIFVKHPYDVGDRIDLELKEYIVEHISLLYTVFRQVETNKSVQVPNNILNGKYVENVTRSGPMREVVMFNVHFDTSMREIMLLRSELMMFVEENNRDFRSDNLNVEINAVKLDSLELRVEIRYKGNWADQPKRVERRNKFMSALVAALRKIPIYGPGAGDPGLGEGANAQYFVTIDPTEAQRRKEQAAKDKEAKRFKTEEEIEAEEATKEASSSTPGSVPLAGPTILTTSPSQTNLNMQTDPRDDTLLGDDASLISRTRSTRRNDLNQVRDILRMQSTTGRRRRNGSLSTQGGVSPIVRTTTGFQSLAPSQSRDNFRRPSIPSPISQLPPQQQFYQSYAQPGSSYHGQPPQPPPQSQLPQLPQQQQQQQQQQGQQSQYPQPGPAPRDPRDPSNRDPSNRV